MITIYTVSFNEEIMIKFFINHYRMQFPNCRIVIHDNMSSDGTVKIAKENNCEVVPYDTGNKILDSRYLEIKNNCWKNAKTDWVVVCDVDELIFITEEELLQEDAIGSTIIKFNGHEMINLEENYDLTNIKYGSPSAGSNKYYCFNKRHIEEIRYSPGCHAANPSGNIVFSLKKYFMGHFKMINTSYLIKRHKLFASRLSDENKRHGWGYHYLLDDGALIKHMSDCRKSARKLLP